jgi:mRNA interferase RelE/StbE
MKLTQTERFIHQFRRLAKGNPRVVTQVEKTFRYLIAFPPAHPSLRMKRVQGTDAVFECSVNMDLRITFEFVDEHTILLRNINHHDKALKHY